LYEEGRRNAATGLELFLVMEMSEWINWSSLIMKRKRVGLGFGGRGRVDSAGEIAKECFHSSPGGGNSQALEQRAADGLSLVR
jgi:hypothetical protein